MFETLNTEDISEIIKNMGPGRVDIVEDDDSVRNSVRMLLLFAGYEVHVWSDPKTFLNNVPQTAPSVLITDMKMPGMTGIEMHEQLLSRGRLAPVIYMSGESTLPQGISAMKLGAVEFLIKPFSREALLKAVASGMEKDRLQMLHLIEQARFDQAMSQLAPREREVMELLLKGYANAEIVETLNISLPTAKQYKSQIMRKLGARSLSQLMKMSQTLSNSA